MPISVAPMLGIGPSLAIALDCWGQTIAYRFATVHEAVFRKHARGRGAKDHNGFDQTLWSWQRDWRRGIRHCQDYPPMVGLSPWAEEIILSWGMPREPVGKRMVGTPGDPKAIQLGYVTVDKLLGYRQAPFHRLGKPLQGLLCWLFAAPHVAGAWGPFSVSSWVEYSEESVREAGEEIYTQSLSDWCRKTNKRLAISKRHVSYNCSRDLYPSRSRRSTSVQFKMGSFESSPPPLSEAGI